MKYVIGAVVLTAVAVPVVVMVNDNDDDCPDTDINTIIQNIHNQNVYNRDVLEPLFCITNINQHRTGSSDLGDLEPEQIEQIADSVCSWPDMPDSICQDANNRIVITLLENIKLDNDDYADGG